MGRRKRTGRRLREEAGKAENERVPTRRQGRRELHEKDSGQQNVFLPLHFQSE